MHTEMVLIIPFCPSTAGYIVATLAYLIFEFYGYNVIQVFANVAFATVLSLALWTQAATFMPNRYVTVARAIRIRQHAVLEHLDSHRVIPSASTLDFRNSSLGALTLSRLGSFLPLRAPPASAPKLQLNEANIRNVADNFVSGVNTISDLVYTVGVGNDKVLILKVSVRKYHKGFLLLASLHRSNN